MKPRCGRVMLAYEAVWGALLDDVLCGRPEGHNGQCRSVQSIRKTQERVRENWPRYRAKRQLRRMRMQERLRLRRLYDAVEAASRKARDRELGTRTVDWP